MLSNLLPFSPFLLWPLGLLFLTSLCCFHPRASAEIAPFAPLVPGEVHPFLSGYKFCLLATELCGRIFIPECSLTNLIDPEPVGTCDPTALCSPPHSALCPLLYTVFMDHGGPCTSLWADLSSTALSCLRIQPPSWAMNGAACLPSWFGIYSFLLRSHSSRPPLQAVASACVPLM